MKFKEYVERTNKLLKERPEIADFNVVSSSDDEGNSFNYVVYSPVIGVYDEKEKDFVEGKEDNSVCIN